METLHILSISPPIVENIFKFLSSRDLRSCAQVCSFWRSMAETEKNRRKRIEWFLQTGAVGLYSCAHHSFRSCPISRVENMESALHAQINKSRIEPSFCLAFVTNWLLDCFGEYFPNMPKDPSFKKRFKVSVSECSRTRKYVQAAIETSLKPVLPKQCPLTFTIAPGIIASLQNCVPMEIEDGPAICGFMFPKLPGVNVRHFPAVDKLSEVENLVADISPVKCLLVFISLRGMSFTNKFVQSCLFKENSQLAIGGAIVKRTESLLGSIVAFSGENVEAASVVISSRDRKEEIEKKLKVFQESGLLKHQCTAFMFSCVGRGFYLYHERHVECSIFHKLFPRVPLIGVFGNGEIGVNYSPHLPTENTVIEIGKLRRFMRKFLHSYSTIFVLISIKT